MAEEGQLVEYKDMENKRYVFHTAYYGVVGTVSHVFEDSFLVLTDVLYVDTNKPDIGLCVLGQSDRVNPTKMRLAVLNMNSVLIFFKWRHKELT